MNKQCKQAIKQLAEKRKRFGYVEKVIMAHELGVEIAEETPLRIIIAKDHLTHPHLTTIFGEGKANPFIACADIAGNNIYINTASPLWKIYMKYEPDVLKIIIECIFHEELEIFISRYLEMEYTTSKAHSVIHPLAAYLGLQAIPDIDADALELGQRKMYRYAVKMLQNVIKRSIQEHRVLSRK